jgi:hypothetical protein
LYALQLNKTFSQFGFSKNAARNTSQLMDNCAGTFEGMTGKIDINPDCNRIPSELGKKMGLRGKRVLTT